MIKKTKLLFLSAIFIVAAPAKAADIKPKINKGDVELGGSLDFNMYSPGVYSVFNAEIGGQYFFADKFSAGLDLSVWRVGKYSLATAIGPVFTKYFWTKDSIAPYVSLRPFSWSKTEGERSYVSSSVRLGTKFFPTDNVSIGPAIDYKIGWRHGYQQHSLGFLGALAVHF